MKLSQVFQKPPRNQQTVKGCELQAMVNKHNAGEITIYAMQTVTGHNGQYKLHYTTNAVAGSIPAAAQNK